MIGVGVHLCVCVCVCVCIRECGSNGDISDANATVHRSGHAPFPTFFGGGGGGGLEQASENTGGAMKTTTNTPYSVGQVHDPLLSSLLSSRF